MRIISCSRKTDVVGFHYAFLQECLKSQYTMLKNNYNKGSSILIDLAPENVHSIVLWSKNFENVVRNPGYLENYNLYFQFTITGYNKIAEKNVPSHDVTVKQMEFLANRYRPETINWRFDPICICSAFEYDQTSNAESSRLNMFEALCKDISSFGVKRCTISFMSEYDKVMKRLQVNKIEVLSPTTEQKILFLNRMVEIASKYGIQIYTCASPEIENVEGIEKSHCIDGALLQKLFGKKISNAKDQGQRPSCGCAVSTDIIGSYSDYICKHIERRRICENTN